MPAAVVSFRWASGLSAIGRRGRAVGVLEQPGAFPWFPRATDWHTVPKVL